MRKLRGKLSYANAMATIAVFIALGGAAYASTVLPKNSVGAKQLRKGAVTAAKIKKGAVNASKVRTNSLTGSQIDESKLGTVPTAGFASNAAAVGGVGIGDILAGSRPLVGHAVATSAGAAIIDDTRTGLRITTPLSANGSLRFLNTNAADAIVVNGVGFNEPSKVEAAALSISHGQEKTLAFSGGSFVFGNFEAQRASAGVETLSFTCARSGETYSCVGTGG